MVKNMNKAILTIISSLGIVGVLFAISASNIKNDEVEVSATSTELDTAQASFTWRFAEAKTNNLDGLPQTDIFLTIKYHDRVIEQLVDTVDGNCSEIEGEKYEGDISTTGRVQCYAAGLGQQYRIQQSKYLFFVERKYLEEALPETPEVEYDWQKISDFSFT